MQGRPPFLRDRGSSAAQEMRRDCLSILTRGWPAARWNYASELSTVHYCHSIWRTNSLQSRIYLLWLLRRYRVLSVTSGRVTDRELELCIQAF